MYQETAFLIYSFFPRLLEEKTEILSNAQHSSNNSMVEIGELFAIKEEKASVMAQLSKMRDQLQESKVRFS